jgi:hypothetical protein
VRILEAIDFCDVVQVFVFECHIFQQLGWRIEGFWCGDWLAI